MGSAAPPSFAGALTWVNGPSPIAHRWIARDANAQCETKGQAALITRREVLAASMAVTIAGCGRRATDRLTWWGIGAEGENAPRLLPRFEAETGIHVEVQSLPWTGAHEKLLSGHAGGSLPDVMMLPNLWLPELAMLGALAPVPARRGGVLRGQFPALARAVHVDGVAMAAPWIVESWIQYYRRDLLAPLGYAQPPARWDDWMHMAMAYKRRHSDRYVTLHLLNWPEPLINFAAQTGEPLLRDRAARGNFASSGFKAALVFYKSIYDQDLSPKVTGVEAGDSILDFCRGRYAILPSTTETMGQLRRPTYNLSADRWSATETPGPTGREGVWTAGNCLAVSARSRQPEKAWALIDHLCSVPAELQFHELTGDLPSRPAAWRAPQLARSGPEQAFARAIGKAVVGHDVPESLRINTEVQLVAEHMVRGDYGVDAAAAEMDRRVDAILTKRRWLLDKGLIA